MVPATSEASPGLLSGYFARFGEWAEINTRAEGHFMERFALGAFLQSMAKDRARIKVLYTHGMDPVATGKPIATLRTLREDSQGGYYDALLLDAPYVRDLVPGLAAGVYGSSMRFVSERTDVTRRPPASEHNPERLPEVTHTRARLIEIGPTALPAYTGTTAALIA